ncbi:MAG: hypothetical protein IPO87_14130 [Flavobacteriales bacterium]|nr:hypothetical protein [Flavobacteriales bacterium]
MNYGSGADDPPNRYFSTGTGAFTQDYQSSSSWGVVLSNGATIVDVVGLNTANVFAAGTGVTASDWTGNTGATSGFAGLKRTAAMDSNTASDWIIATNAIPLTMGVFNPGYTNPNTGTISSYSWSPVTFLDDPSLASPTASSVTATTAYTVTVTGAPGCSAQGTVTLTVNPAISGATITPATPRYCAGSSVTLTANAIDGGGVLQYQWTDPNSNAAGTNQTQLVNIPGLWQVTITDDCGGSPATTSITVIEDPTPISSPTAGPACLGQTLQLTGGNTAGPGASYAWTGPNGFTSTNQSPSITGLTNAAAGVYSFTVTSAAPANCVSAPGSVTISVNVPPTITVPASATPGTICAGGSTQLSVTASAPGYVLGSGGSSFIDISTTGGRRSQGVGDDTEHPHYHSQLYIQWGSLCGCSRWCQWSIGFNWGTTGAVNNGNLALPATFGAGPVGLAVFWDDLDNLSTTQIYTQQVGNLFIIQWHANAVTSQLLRNGGVTFQAQLNSSDLCLSRRQFRWCDPAQMMQD